MEKYKKKSLNFMGYSRELRKTQRDNQRDINRHQRLSTLRDLEESITEENKIKESRIPIGKSNQTNSRVEMLQKWKQEKMMKKQQESKLKKPAFKVGFIKSNPPPCLSNTPSKLFKTSFQMSNSQLYTKKQESLNVSKSKTNAKDSSTQVSAKKPEVCTVNIKTGAKDIKNQSSASKIVVPSKPDSKWAKNKESGIQSFNMKPKVDPKSKVLNKDQISSNKKYPTISSKPPLEIKKSDQVLSYRTQLTIGSKPSLETKKTESQLKPLNAKYKVTSTVKDTRSNIPSFGLSKTTVSRSLSTETKQGIPKKNTAVKSIPKFSKTVASQQKGSNSEKSESKVPESDHLTNQSNKVATLDCEVSLIEPVKEQRKSFAPPGFMFQPPVELNSSLFLEDGPSAIFLRMKNQFLRTSTPKQSPSSQKPTSETEDSKSLEDEDIKCKKHENTQSLKNEEKIEDVLYSENAENKLVSSHKCDIETVLSSFESVFINDAKKSLKFEFPDVASAQNQEVLLSSKITNPELSLAQEPASGEAMNPSIQLDSIESGKTEINTSYTGPVDDNKIAIPLPEVDSALSEIPDPTYIQKSIDCEQYIKSEIPEIVSTQNQEKMLPFSPSIMLPKNSMAIEPIHQDAVNPPILPDSVEINKTEINSTDPEDHSKITGLLPVVDHIVSEMIPDPTCFEQDENSENDQSVLNGFLQNQENCLIKIPERKIRNFKRSEKPGLSSINESLENTPRSALKKKVLDSVFTPRRSLRLAKLSGNFSSLENLLPTPKQKEKEDKAGSKDFTPRRSSRLSKFSTEFSSAENLFDVRRPTLYGSPDEDAVVPKINSRVTYDFDRLSLETEEETRPYNTRGGKVSLLYTPPNKSRPSIMRHSIKGDLMSFSPSA